MNTEFRKAELPRELGALLAFDRKVFPAADRFPEEYWRECESWWMRVGRSKVGCCAFERDRPRRGWLYIASTAILPGYQRRGLGSLIKAWQIAYARGHGFRRIVTNSRKSNVAMIALNRKAGFRVVREIRNYYAEPDEAAVTMELQL